MKIAEFKPFPIIDGKADSRMIYLDHNATTPVDAEVLDAMLPYFGADFGNAASSQHRLGWVAREAVERSRHTIASAIGADEREVVFTSGATESCNLALKGIFSLYQRKGKHLVVAETEHKAVLDVAYFLRKRGAEVTFLPVNGEGLVDLQQLEDAIRADTVLVSIMWANNETGVLQPVGDIGRICAERGTVFFCDATQAVGKVPIDVRQAGIQLMAFSAHKLYGPKGVGALYVSSRSPKIKLEPVIHGGGHEGGLRSGTLNVPGIVGFATALEMMRRDYPVIRGELKALRDRLESQLTLLPSVVVHAGDAPRLEHVASVRFDHIDAGALMASLQYEIAVAAGSACTSADPSPSHVLRAMGLNDDQARSSIRFSLGKGNTAVELDRAVDLVRNAVERLRAESPAWQMHLKGHI